MGFPTIRTWISLMICLLAVYLLVVGFTAQRLQKWARKNEEHYKSSLDVRRQEVIVIPFLWAAAVCAALVFAWSSIHVLHEELPTKISGGWPRYEGTIVEWHRGYRWSDYAVIQNEQGSRSFRLRNPDIRCGEMVGVEVRVAYNDGAAYVLDYKEGDAWVRKMRLPNFGREKNVVQKTIAANLLAGAVLCGFSIRKILRPHPNPYLKNKLLRAVLGCCLSAFTAVNAAVLCYAVLHYQATLWGAELLSNSQLSMLLLLCAHVVFCILCSRKTDVWQYWRKAGKELSDKVEEERKKGGIRRILRGI